MSELDLLAPGRGQGEPESQYAWRMLLVEAVEAGVVEWSPGAPTTMAAMLDLLHNEAQAESKRRFPKRCWVNGCTALPIAQGLCRAHLARDLPRAQRRRGRDTSVNSLATALAGVGRRRRRNGEWLMPLPYVGPPIPADPLDLGVHYDLLAAGLL